jgi:hypothetical protein
MPIGVETAKKDHPSLDMTLFLRLKLHQFAPERQFLKAKLLLLGTWAGRV